MIVENKPQGNKSLRKKPTVWAAFRFFPDAALFLLTGAEGKAGLS
jgi:hypothetical protein